MQMREVESITIPPNRHVELQPCSLNIMLRDLVEPGRRRATDAHSLGAQGRSLCAKGSRREDAMGSLI